MDLQNNKDFFINNIEMVSSPSISIISPLYIDDRVSNDTLSSITKNNTSYNWISVESKNNTMKNFEIGINYLKEKDLLADYVIKIDNDTIWEPHTLDYLIYTLKNTQENICYSYCSFKYEGYINIKFPAIKFNSEKLKQGNYISSNSLFKSSIFNKINLVIDDKYKRLLDWAYYLKLLNNGYYGIASPGFFIAKSSKKSISASSKEDYKIKFNRVIKDFLK
jgi:hypothetical protein